MMMKIHLMIIVRAVVMNMMKLTTSIKSVTGVSLIHKTNLSMRTITYILGTDRQTLDVCWLVWFGYWCRLMAAFAHTWCYQLPTVRGG